MLYGSFMQGGPCTCLLSGMNTVYDVHAEKTLHRFPSRMHSFTGLLNGENLPQVFFIRRSFAGLPLGDELSNVLCMEKTFRSSPGWILDWLLYGRYSSRQTLPRCSIWRWPFPDLLFGEDLSLVFCSEKTFSRSSVWKKKTFPRPSIRRRSLPDFLFWEDFFHVFYSEKAFPSPSIWKRRFPGFLFGEDLS